MFPGGFAPPDPPTFLLDRRGPYTQAGSLHYAAAHAPLHSARMLAGPFARSALSAEAARRRRRITWLTRFRSFAFLFSTQGAPQAASSARRARSRRSRSPARRMYGPANRNR